MKRFGSRVLYFIIQNCFLMVLFFYFYLNLIFFSLSFFWLEFSSAIAIYHCYLANIRKQTSQTDNSLIGLFASVHFGILFWSDKPKQEKTTGPGLVIKNIIFFCSCLTMFRYQEKRSVRRRREGGREFFSY